MGLDMYLTKRTYVKNWAHMKPEELTNVTIEGAKAKGIKNERISEIIEDVMYWRKANQIHAWFVENCVGKGEDWHGSDVYVTRDQLKQLLDTCETVLDACKLVPAKIKNGTTLTREGMEDNMEDGFIVENPVIAMSLLPSTSGFFFGSTEYDQYYVDDLKETIKCLNQLLSEEEGAGSFYYSASW
jgi:hypothetical protein